MSSETLSPEQEREVENLLRMANLQRMRGQLTLAADTVKKALDINPKDPGLHEMLGDVLRESGELNQALETFKAAMALFPDRPPPL